MTTILKYLVFVIFVGGLFSALISISVHKKNIVPQTNQAANTTAIQPFAVVEIFTTEGCSNCPPAYKVVEKVLETANKYQLQVILLDFHVDYFNDPWVDPYSSPLYTERQENYGKVFPKAGVFTPQMIVNGSEAMLASNSKMVHAAIDKALNTMQVSRITIQDAKRDKDGYVKVHFTTENIPGDSMITIALVQKKVVQKVPSGENAGATLTHHNVVRSLQLVKAKDEKVSITLPSTSVSDSTVYQVIAFRQTLPTMNITAADQKEVSADAK